ncbi:CD302 protein, partial [Amia calva]|nr:CD302 protein [Amia calva]
DCPSDSQTWVPFENSCYYFVHGKDDIAKSYTIEEAKEICRAYELVSIKSAEENNFIVQYIPRVWKGNLNVWLGMYYDTDNDTLKWQDESEVAFSQWEDGELSTGLSAVDVCAALHSVSGQWQKVSCAEDLEHGVVCKTSQNSSNRPLLSALVILSVLIILAVSTAFWFFHQKHSSGSGLFTSFEYHPPFRSPTNDEASLVEAEE